jgi:hypothetical protein
MRIPQLRSVGNSLGRVLRNRRCARRFSALTPGGYFHGQVSVQIRRIEEFQLQEQLEQIELQQEQLGQEEVSLEPPSARERLRGNRERARRDGESRPACERSSTRLTFTGFTPVTALSDREKSQKSRAHAYTLASTRARARGVKTGVLLLPPLRRIWGALSRPCTTARPQPARPCGRANHGKS